jgi:regulatory protein
MQISKLTPSKHKQGRWLVQLEDGSLLRVGEEQMADFALYTGMELEEETLQALLSASEGSALRERALDLVTRRPYARAELVRKLGEKGAAPQQAEEAADWLERLGLLNDREFAATLVRHYSAKGYGPMKLKDELYRRGVPRELWQEALLQANDPAAAIDAFLARRWGESYPDRRECKRAADALARKGYLWQDISAGLARYTQESYDVD